MLHDITEKHLNAGFFSLDHVIIKDLTQEQASAVRDCLEYARKIVGLSGKFVTETRVHLTRAHHKLKDCHGTADLIVFNPVNSVLHVIDWKFGKGVEVGVEDNPQLKAYGLGAWLEGNTIWPDVKEDIESVEVHVVQPRLYNYQSLNYDVAELMDWAEYQLVPAIENAESPDPHFEAGENQCRWCPVKQQCGRRHEFAQEVAQEVFRQYAVTESGDEIPADEVEFLLKSEKFLVTYMKDARANLMNNILSGQKSTTFKIVAGRSIRRWSDDKAVGAYLIDRFDPEAIFKTKLISPAMAETMLTPEERKSDEFQALWEKPAGKLAMVTMDDRRKAIESPAQEAFKDYVE